MMNDFLSELIGFFRTPFDGSDDINSKKYFRQPAYNNFPAMTTKIKVENFWIVILNSLRAPKKCLAVNLNADYLQEFIGDGNMGPGSTMMDINTELVKLMTCNVNKIYKEEVAGIHSYSISTVKLIERFLGDIKEEDKLSNRGGSGGGVLLAAANAVEGESEQTPKKTSSFFNRRVEQIIDK